jgi:carbamoyl-phosphate synthase large subunit
VLISSAGRRVALLEAFRWSLDRLHLDGRVVAADASPLAAAGLVADEAVLVPPCTSPEFVPALLDVCARRDVALVIPTIDTELPVLASAREEFRQAGVAVAVSSPDTVRIGADKACTHDWLVAQGLPTVRQAPVDLVGSRPEEWPYPFLVKPRRGSASKGVAVVRDGAELEVATRDGDFVAQSLAPGREYTIDVLMSTDARFVCAVPRLRLEVRAGEVSKGMTVRMPELEQLARRVGEHLPGARGPLTVQVFWDAERATGAIIEINPRFGGGFPLSWEAGARYPLWMLEELHGLPSTARADAWRDGLVMLRYDAARFATGEELGL